MIYLPKGRYESTPTQTHRSRELSEKVERVIRDFQRDHPELTDDEIHAALAGSAIVTRHLHRRNAARRPLAAVVLGGAAALAAGVTILADQSEGLLAGSSATTVMIAGGVGVAGVVLLALFLIARR